MRVVIFVLLVTLVILYITQCSEGKKAKVSLQQSNITIFALLYLTVPTSDI